MYMTRKRIEYIFSKAGLQTLRANFLQAVGVLWLLIEVSSFFTAKLTENKEYLLYVILLFSFFWTVAKSLPPLEYRKKSKASNVEIELKTGNLFDEVGSIAFGCSECFDTEVEKVIGSKSLMAQLVNNSFEGRHKLLDNEISQYLELKNIIGITDKEKSFGKEIRYDLGTVAVVRKESRKFFLTAFSATNSDTTTTTTTKDLWISFYHLWSAVRSNNQLEPIAVPVMGAGLARSSFSRISLIQLLLLSFSMCTRELKVCQKLTLVVSPDDYEPEEMANAIMLIKALEF